VKLIHIDITREARKRLEKRRKEGETVYAVINRLLDATETDPRKVKDANYPYI
jgi:hypothetical protein